MHLDSSLWGTNGISVATGGCPHPSHAATSALGLISLLLPTQVAEVSPRLEALCCEAKALAHDTAQAESGFTTVKSEKDLQGLQSLQSRQQEMEVSPGAPWPAGCLTGRCQGWMRPSQGGTGSRGPRCRQPWHTTVSRLEFSSGAQLGPGKGEHLRQLPCASAQLPVPRSSFCQWGGDSGGHAEKPQPFALLIIPMQHHSLHDLGKPPHPCRCAPLQP